MKMQTRNKRMLSILMTIGMIITLVASLWTASYAAPALPGVNTETRHQTVCRALSDDALAYYTGSYTYSN